MKRHVINTYTYDVIQVDGCAMRRCYATVLCYDVVCYETML